jgi:hypothetical protein
MEKFWMVWRVGGQGPTKKHGSLEEAKAEAERLAISFPGRQFMILEAITYCEIKNPVLWKEVIDPLPF